MVEGLTIITVQFLYGGFLEIPLIYNIHSAKDDQKMVIRDEKRERREKKADMYTNWPEPFARRQFGGLSREEEEEGVSFCSLKQKTTKKQLEKRRRFHRLRRLRGIGCQETRKQVGA